MKHIPKNEWYLDKCTWCGVTKDGERYYPVSWNDDSTAYGMTKILSRCLDFHNQQQARKMLEVLSGEVKEEDLREIIYCLKKTLLKVIQ